MFGSNSGFGRKVEIFLGQREVVFLSPRNIDWSKMKEKMYIQNFY